MSAINSASYRPALPLPSAVSFLYYVYTEKQKGVQNGSL